MRWALLVLVALSAVLGALFLSACGSKDGSTTSSTAARPASANSPDARASSPPPPKDLVIKDLKRGKGRALPPISHKPRVTMTLLYTAAEYETGRVFERRQNPRRPAKIEYGPGLNEGWEKGLVGMRVGGRRELIVPASMMIQGAASRYVIELLSMKKNGTKLYARQLKQGLMMSKQDIAQLPPLTVPRQSGPPPKHIKIVDLRKGTGVAVRKFDTVYVRYLQIPYLEALKKSHTEILGPESFGLENTVKGWTLGLPGMRVGGRRELILPPWLVYPRWKPSWGYKPYVDIYVIDLLGIKPPLDAYSRTYRRRAALQRKSSGG